MVFSSIIFLLLFLPVTLLLYFAASSKLKNLVLLLLSLFFYAWGEGFYTMIMLVSIAANYTAGICIEQFRRQRRSKVIYYSAIIINLGILSAFKYSNFIVDNINVLFSFANLKPILLAPVHLPIGISFFTFQAISYIMDIYRGDTPALKNPVNMGLYIASFPQLIAGPIVRYHTVSQQIIKRKVTCESFIYGVERFITGLGKKVLIANTISVVVDQVYALPQSELTVATCWVGILCYSLQIYFDFSGYSDMAIGLGHMFGFKFPENFNYPYIARSMQDFWRRWHISLTSFIRDYLFLPIAIKKRYWKKWGIIYAFVISFSLVGLWHGSSWNFVLWGIFHGIFLIAEHIGLNKTLIKFPSLLQFLYVHFILSLSWPLFRAESLSGAWAYYKGMAGVNTLSGIEYETSLLLTAPVLSAVIFGILFSTPLYPAIKKKLIQKEQDVFTLSGGIFSFTNTLLFAMVLLASLMCLSAGAYNPFIYFRF